jgi:cation diffusion facilitator family transporter
MESSTLSSTAQTISTATAGNQLDVRLRAGVVSLAVGVVLLGLKYFAYQLTGSTAILSDALESIVNVVAAVFALAGLTIARWPADRNHPYGHGKIEFFSAAFEGGLIAFAALLIIYQAMQGLLFGLEIRSLNVGVLITLGAGLANGALGWFLIRVGKRHHSVTLIADGKHVMSDFVTSLGITIGLGLVILTGRVWLDPLVAVLVGVQLGFTGFGLVRHAADGLLDAEDPILLKRLLDAISTNLEPGIIRVHFLRAIRSGRFTHVDAHLVIPEFWTVEEAHAVGDAFEQRVIDALPFEGEIVFHVDPCQRRYCSMCDVAQCPIREAPFEGRPPLTLDEVTRREDPRLQA